MKKFTAKELLSKTMPFVWAKLMLRLITFAIFLGLFALGIFMIVRGSAGVGYILWIMSGLAGSLAYNFLVRVGGYAVRVGHVAVLTETIKTGQLPENQVVYGKNKVVERIGTAAAFFVINRLVDRAVLQLQRRLQSAASFLGAIPGAGALVKFANTVLKAALKYVDDCCVAWIFYNPAGQSAMKGALDGVTIYAQNWKKILGSAVKTAAIVTVMTYIGGFIIGIVLAIIFGAIGGLWGVFGFIFGLAVSLIIKQAFIDSWIMIRTLLTYFEDAPTTQIRVDMYGTLSGMAPAFKDMLNRVKGEVPGDPFSAPAASAVGTASSNVFCGECGAKNPSGTRFCGECGQAV